MALTALVRHHPDLYRPHLIPCLPGRGALPQRGVAQDLEGVRLIHAPSDDILRTYPAGIIRSIAARVLPICRAAQAQVAEARAIVQPVLEKRKAAKAAAAAAGKTIEFSDAIERFENVAAKSKASYEPAAMQLFLSLVAIHTTSDLMTQIMTDLAGHPEVIEDLLREIKEVLSDGGWKKTSLTNMKLLDSVIKESQRLKPIQLGEPTIPTMQGKLHGLFACH